MDIAAHALWAGAGVLVARRYGMFSHAAQRNRTRPKWTPPNITWRTVILTMVMAALPDLIHGLPLIGWWVFGSGTAAELYAYAIAAPGHVPPTPPLVERLSHHLHCMMHSAITTTAAALMLWLVLRTLWIPLLGWWLHVVMDVFTHSATFYPSPVLYPFTQQGFDGIAWNTPWFMLLNYISLAATWGWFGWMRWRARNAARAAPPLPARSA